jgi:hypothetical protein
MAIKQAGHGAHGSGQGLGVDVGAQAGEGSLLRGDMTLPARGEEAGGMMDIFSAGPKPLKPLAHGVLDYAMAGTLMAAPWLFGFSRNKRATANAVVSGLSVLGLSLMTRYPLGAVKQVPFPVHGVIETVASLLNVAAPWTLGFSNNKRARMTHVLSGLAYLGVIAVTDYRAAERPGGADTPSLNEVLPQGVTQAFQSVLGTEGNASGDEGETGTMAASARGGA